MYKRMCLLHVVRSTSAVMGLWECFVSCVFRKELELIIRISK